MVEENKNGAGDTGKISLTVGDKTVEKTLDELKELATGALSNKDNETFTVKIVGEDKIFTREEALQRISEAGGAQKRFDEAAKSTQKAARGLRIQELVDEMKNSEQPDRDKATEFFKLIGIDNANIDELLEGNAEPPKRGSEKVSKPIGLDDLDPRVRATIEAAEQSDLRQIRERIEREAKKGVDNDKILGKMIDEVPDTETREKFKTVLYDMMFDDVRGRILAREAYGPEMVLSSLQKVRARITGLGIPSRTAGQPPMVGEFGISGALSPKVQATEPIKRVPSTESGYDENAVLRMQQKVIQAARKLGR